MGALLTAEQAAERLGMCERTLRKLRQRGEIAYIALTDRKFAYTEADCDEFLAARRRKEQPCPFVKTPARRTGSTTSRGMGSGFMAQQASRRAEMRKDSKRS